MKRKDNIFSDAMFRKPQSNRFDMSHEFKYSTNLGRLTPSCVQECLPGDVWNIASTDFVRFLPLRSPVMHRFRAHKYWFFVPNRILWAGFPDWIFDADNTDENPYIIIDDVVEVGSLADYMGIPAGDYSNIPGGYKVNLLPFAAYLLIHDEFFKQQFIQVPSFSEIVPGDNSVSWRDFCLALPLTAAWEKDYFTTCTPFPQDSATGVQIPLTFQDNVPVTLTDPPTGAAMLGSKASDHDEILNSAAFGTSAAGELRIQGNNAVIDPNGNLVVDVQSDAALVTDLRRAIRLQEFLEKIITGGKRYIETLKTIFGVSSSDARLQRPEYIMGSVNNVVVSEVLATTQDADAGQNLGSMGGHAISVGGSDNAFYRCEEHGWLISLFVIRPDTAYQDGLARHWFRSAPLDYAIPDFALIGEQAVLTKELLGPLGIGQDPDAVFGYQKRYAEYMYASSRVASNMRGTLAFWHNARVFDDPNDPPVLAEEFISCEPRLDIFASIDILDDHLVVQTLNHLSVQRKLPRYAIPTL